MKWYLWGAVVLLYSLFGSACSTERRYDLSAYGLSPVENVDNAPAMARALEQIREKCEENQTIVVTLPKGRYEFYPDSAAERVYFISNHDQMNPKKVGLPFEGMKNMVFDGVIKQAVLKVGVPTIACILVKEIIWHLEKCL